MNCTIFKNIYSKEPNYKPIDVILDRIEKGKSKELVEKIRKCKDKEEVQKLKCNLPAICFSGEFDKDRTDKSLKKHNGFIVLDFDNVPNIRNRQTEIISNDFIYACWISPSGRGLKALVRIADGRKHKEHFEALREIFPEIDRSGANVSRVCYESYDPDIYIYPDSVVFTQTKSIVRSINTEINLDEEKVFKKLLSWLADKREAFVTGERNNFIFKLAAACCRFGVVEISARNMIHNEFLVNSDFTISEADRAIRSAYKANAERFGDSVMENALLVDKETKKEVKIDSVIFDENIKPKDVIYGSDVRDKAINLYLNGYDKVDGIGVVKFDELYKPKRGELTLLTGIGNAGKSTLKKWYQVYRAILFGEKFGCFGPEDSPAEEYYHDLTEILLGADCTPSNHFRPKRYSYETAYDFITKHFFYIYPESAEPTPEYVQERFLELIIKEKIDGCDIDPFNQMANKYFKHQGRDKYLEYFLSMFGRFAQTNQIYFWIIAHPKLLEKDKTGNYVCPDVFDVHDGSMWNNKMDNILVYHRPYGQTDPSNTLCEFHSKKIRRQKIVGKKGFVLFEMNFPKRRFIFDSIDPMNEAINSRKLNFETKQPKIEFKPAVNDWLPYKDDSGDEVTF